MDFDVAIFVGFLVVTFVVGLLSSRGITSIKGYAIGNKDFTTATLASTIVATWVGGQFFVTTITETYNKGIGFVGVVVLGEFLALLIVGIVFVPRMSEFIGKLSIAEAMGDIYGKNVRTVTAISGFIGVSGIIALQLKIAGLLFGYALGVPITYGIVLSGVVITLYSAFGGIKSVTFTDSIQFLTFGIIIPTIAYFLFNNITNTGDIVDTLTDNPLFDYGFVFSFSNPEIYYYLSLLLWIMIPSFNPALFQRISMARDVKQARLSFIIASSAVLFLAIIICWIGVLVLSIYPNIIVDDILQLIISDYAWITGFKGLILTGIMAMVMSTVDSYINSSAVLFTHDLRESLNLTIIKNELFATRICSLVVGTLSILLAMRSGSFLDLIILANMFYMPIVTPPFMMTIFGFRSSSKSVLIGMGAGFLVAMIWEVFFKVGNVGGLIPGMIANFVFLMGSHYLLKQRGGWVGIKDPSSLIEIKKKRKQRFQALIREIISFDLVQFLKSNTPKADSFIALLGGFIMISTFFGTNLLLKEVRDHYAVLLNILYPFTLCMSTALISYPLWQSNRKNTILMPVLWNITMLCILICFSFLMVLISDFSEISLMVFMVNMIVISSLLRWGLAIFYIILGISVTLFCYENYFISYQVQINFVSLEFKIVYLLLLLSSTLIIFLRPKQEYLEATEAKVYTLASEVTHLDHELTDMSGKVTDLTGKVTNLNDQVTHYSERVADQQVEIERLGATAQKILNNVNHEMRIPIGSVMNFSDMLHESLMKSDDTHLQKLSDEVVQNSTRLSSMILNMLDLAMLDAKKIELNKKTVNFSELVEDRVKSCRSVYLQGKPINFKLTIEPEIMISVDPNYIRQVVDNIVINAISFSEEGLIEVTVLRQKNFVTLVITDQGKGIPPLELSDIFTPFKMGSNCESKADGRGVGLALCKSAVEAHGGAIKAESKGKGAMFRVVLPF